MAHAEDANAHRLHGLLAEFDSPDALVAAGRGAVAEGYSKLDAYTPFPVEALNEALGFHRTRVPLVVLVGAIVGLVSGYGLQYWAAGIAYPLNVGGRPYHSWPAFVPVTFETTVLFAALAAVFGMLALNGLPQPYHPVFNAPRFALASRDRFFLSIESRDPKFDLVETRLFLERFDPREVTEVEA